MPTPRVILREWGLCIGPYSLESIFLTGLLFRHLTQIKDVSIKVIIETSGSSERERDREREREGGRQTKKERCSASSCLKANKQITIFKMFITFD
jgi:hypothetical protein